MYYRLKTDDHLLEERVLLGKELKIAHFKFDGEFSANYRSSSLSIILPLSKSCIDIHYGKKKYSLSEEAIMLVKENTTVKVCSVESYGIFIALILSSNAINNTLLNCVDLKNFKTDINKTLFVKINKWLFECIHRYYFELITDRFQVKYSRPFLEVEIIKELIFLTNSSSVSSSKDDFYPSLEVASQMPISLEKAMRFIEKTPIQKISVVEVCKKSGASQSTLMRMFKKYYGITLQDFLIKRKIIFSKELLENRWLSMYEISELLGYSSASSFITFFKKSVGITPQKYREQRLDHNN